MADLTCNHCGKSKSEDEFNWRWKIRRVRQRTCRDCQKQQKNRWYENNHETHRANMKRNKHANRDSSRKYVWEYLANNPCVDCGETDPMVLEFDHVRGKKKYNVGAMVGEGYTLKAVKAEIAKCDVRCANCHRRKSYADQGWYRE